MVTAPPSSAIIRSYSIENDREFAAAIEKALKSVSDLRLFFTFVAKDWRKSNVAQFTLRGSGQYPPLNPEYKARKTRLRAIPILVGANRDGSVSGRLRDSVTGRLNKDSIQVIGKKAMIMGTTVPYGIYHQSDAPRSKIPLRKFLFIGPEAPSSAPHDIRVGRLQRWLAMLEAETQRKLK